MANRNIIQCILAVLLLAMGIKFAVDLSKNKSSPEISAKDAFLTVQTECGKIEGKEFHVTTDEGKKKTMYTFKAIPYAKPPIKELRWSAPVPKCSPKSSTLKYSDNVVMCKQPKNPLGEDNDWKKSTEDCLVLNIRTPSLNNITKLPVVFWIHGGGMIVGYSEAPGYHPNEQFTASLDIVTVTVNYRLGIFGFLSLKELWETTGKESYANYGIMDLIQALKWVKNNIEDFGGNSTDITIFGHSGGGTAVYGLIISDDARGLFQKAIPASGGTLLPKTYKQGNVDYRDIIDKIGCNQSDSYDVKICLKNAPADSLIKAANYFPWSGLNFPFNKPISGYPIQMTDPVVMPQPIGMLPVDVGNSLTIFITSTAQELSYFKDIKDFDDLKTLLTPRIDSFSKGLYPEVLKLYLNSKLTPNQVTPDYIYDSMVSDVLVTCSNSEVGKYLSHIPNYNIYRAVTAQPPDPRPGQKVVYAYHMWDVMTLFGANIYGKPTTNELMLRSNLRDVYRKFIYSDKSFLRYKDGPLVFWNNTILKLDHPYHKKKCKVWKENGFLKYSW